MVQTVEPVRHFDFYKDAEDAAKRTLPRVLVEPFPPIPTDVSAHGTDTALGKVTASATGGVWALPGVKDNATFQPHIEHPESLEQSADYAEQLSQGKTVQQLIGTEPTSTDKAAMGDALELLGISNRQVAAYAEQAGRGGIDSSSLARPELEQPAGDQGFAALKAAAQMRVAIDGGDVSAPLNSIDKYTLLYHQDATRGFDTKGMIDSAIDGADKSHAYWSSTGAARDLLLGGNNISDDDAAFHGNFAGGHFFDSYKQGTADGKALLGQTQVGFQPDDALTNAGRTLSMDIGANPGPPGTNRQGLQILSAAAITALAAIGRGVMTGAGNAYATGLNGFNALGRRAATVARAAQAAGAPPAQALAAGIQAGVAGYAGFMSPKFQGQFLSAAVLGGGLLANERYGSAGEESLGAKALSLGIGTIALAAATGANGGANLPADWSENRAHGLLVAASFAKHFTAVTVPAGGITIATSYLLGKFWGAKPEAEKDATKLEAFMKSQHRAEYDKFVADIANPQEALEKGFTREGDAAAAIVKLESAYGAQYALDHAGATPSDQEFQAFRDASPEVQAQITELKAARADITLREKELADLTEPFYESAQTQYQNFIDREL